MSDFHHHVVQTQPRALLSLGFADGDQRYFLCPDQLCVQTLGFKTIFPDRFALFQTNNAADSHSPLSSDRSSSGEQSTGSRESSNTSKSLEDLRCCLLCACFEPCTCCVMPKHCDKLYYSLQHRTEKCPSGCPTIVPRPDEEEWKLPGGKAREFACSSCCYSPGGIVCLKYWDCLCCPLCPMWDLLKAVDYGYRRYRVQLVLHRYRDARTKKYIVFV